MLHLLQRFTAVDKTNNIILFAEVSPDNTKPLYIVEIMIKEYILYSFLVYQNASVN